MSASAQVPADHITPSQLLVTWNSLSSHQGRHKELFGKAVIFHSGQKSQKTKPSLGEDGWNTLFLGQLPDGGIPLHVSNGYPKDDPEAADGEAFQTVDLWF